MKAIAVKEDNIKTEIEDCFGKAKYFCFVNNNSQNIEFVSNPGYSSDKESAIKAVSFLRKKGVKTVISVNYGVKAKQLLDKQKIQIVITPPKYRKLSSLICLIKSGKCNAIFK